MGLIKCDVVVGDVESEVGGMVLYVVIVVFVIVML